VSLVLDSGALIALDRDGDLIATSDCGDLRLLASAAGVHVDLIPS